MHTYRSTLSYFLTCAVYDRWGSRNDQEDDAQKRPLDFSEISLAFQQKLQHDMQQFVLTTFYAQQPSVVDIDINVEPNKFSLVFVNSGSLIMGPPVYCNQKVHARCVMMWWCAVCLVRSHFPFPISDPFSLVCFFMHARR